MSAKICNCGNCAQATERAMGIISKMTMDDECPQFAIGVAAAMTNLAGSILHDIIMSTDRVSDVFAALQCGTVIGAINKLIHDEFQENEKVLGDQLLKLLQDRAEKVKQEQELPKGD